MGKSGGQKWISLVKKNRLSEIFLLSGFVICSVPFTGAKAQPANFWIMINMLIGGTLLFASAYSVNSYYGFAADQNNSRFEGRQLNSRAYYGFTAAITLLLSLGLFYCLNVAATGLALINFLASILYSCPGGAKVRPMAGTLVHFIAQISLFQIGFLCLAHVSWGSLSISIFFGLLFASGHLVHELKDFEADQRVRHRTNVVVFGPDRVIRVYKLLIAILLLYWIYLFFTKTTDIENFLPFLMALIAHLALSWRAINKDFLTPAGNFLFQNTYRAIYFLAGSASFILWVLPWKK